MCLAMEDQPRASRPWRASLGSALPFQRWDRGLTPGEPTEVP